MFSIRLKELREEKGLSQRAFAEEFGISKGTVGMWESGAREPKSFKEVIRLADYFNVTTDYLLGLVDEPHFVVLYGKGPYGVKLPKTDKRFSTITTPGPISILAGQYNVSADMLSAIAGIAYNLADDLCTSATGAGYEQLTPEQHKRIIDFFQLGNITKLDRYTPIPLFINQALYQKIHPNTSQSAEDEEMLNSFHRLDPEDQGQVKGFIKGLESGEKYQKADTPSRERTG